MSKKLFSYLGYAIAIFLLVASIAVLRNELKSYSVEDVTQSFSAISIAQVGLAIAFTAVGYLARTGYDVLAFRYLKQPLSYWRIASTNFISSAFSNTIGFAVLTGGAIRYRRYAAWGVSGVAIAQITAFIHITFWLGLFAVGSVAFLSAPLPIPAQLNLPFTTARPLGLAFLAIALSYLVNSVVIKRSFVIKQHRFRFPPLPIAAMQMVVAGLEWAMAAAVIYTLMPTGGIGYFSFLNIYLLSMAAGSLSSLPGGVGVFETLMLLLLADVVPGDVVLASLLAFRIIYFLLPFAIAAVLLLFQEFFQKAHLNQK